RCGQRTQKLQVIKSHVTYVMMRYIWRLHPGGGSISKGNLKKAKDEEKRNGDHIEQRLFTRIKQEREETTKSWGTELENVSKAVDLVVRVVVSVDKELERLVGSCPLLNGQDYIFYYHPETQKTPKEEKLRQWYELMLKKASNEGIVVGHNNFYDQFFVPKREENIKIIAARLPYLDDATMVKGAVLTTITSLLLSEYSFKHGKR
nr:histone acetyltransferase HAC1-like isoform X1 [Tanacetum cinerariifolium]